MQVLDFLLYVLFYTARFKLYRLLFQISSIKIGQNEIYAAVYHIDWTNQ